MTRGHYVIFKFQSLQILGRQSSLWLAHLFLSCLGCFHITTGLSSFVETTWPAVPKLGIIEVFWPLLIGHKVLNHICTDVTLLGGKWNWLFGIGWFLSFVYETLLSRICHECVVFCSDWPCVVSVGVCFLCNVHFEPQFWICMSPGTFLYSLLCPMRRFIGCISPSLAILQA